MASRVAARRSTFAGVLRCTSGTSNGSALDTDEPLDVVDGGQVTDRLLLRGILDVRVTALGRARTARSIVGADHSRVGEHGTSEESGNSGKSDELVPEPEDGQCKGKQERGCAEDSPAF